MAARRNHGTETHSSEGSTVARVEPSSPGPESITTNPNPNGKEAHMARVNLCDIMPSEAQQARNESLRRKGADNQCLVCRRPVITAKSEMFEMLVDLTILVGEGPGDGDVESQGAFPVGPDCARKIKKEAR